MIDIYTAALQLSGSQARSKLLSYFLGYAFLWVLHRELLEDKLVIHEKHKK